MSHGPFGLGGAFRPVPACWAMVNAAPISMSASTSINTALIPVFIPGLTSGRRNLGPVRDSAAAGETIIQRFIKIASSKDAVTLTRPEGPDESALGR